ncbi:MAG TPA: ribokinase [Candidatus Limnocylindria bacterium]|nr:ribokinase [Candidatus Limnocylindria bacterium]
MSGRVIVVGSINTDFVVLADRLPRPGETVLGGQLEVHPGGKGANQAVAAARAGAEVMFIGAIGDDAYGDQALDALATEGIDVSRVRRETGPTGAALIAVGPRGENQIVVAPGANATLTAEVATAVAQLAGEGTVVLTSLEVPMAAVVAAVGAATSAGMRSIVNPAPAHPLPAELLALAPILTPNEHELVVGIGNDDAAAALTELAARIAAPVIVTQGPAGALVAEGQGRDRYDGHPAPRVVDSTGAGDTFNGVLAAWLSDGASLADAVRAANAAGSLSVGAIGARAGMPSRTTIEEALAR